MASLSFKGWNVVEWLKGTVKINDWKEIVKILLPLLVFLFSIDGFWATAFGTVAGKSVLDLVHYFLKE